MTRRSKSVGQSVQVLLHLDNRGGEIAQACLGLALDGRDLVDLLRGGEQAELARLGVGCAGARATPCRCRGPAR